MTLISMIAAPWGVWHCADKRLTDLATGAVYDDDSSKHVTLQCPDGQGIITYTGVGAIRDGRHLSEWVRDQLVGEPRTVDQSLAHMRERATKELGRELARQKIRHVFMLSALFGTDVWVGEIANVESWDGRVAEQFSSRALRLQGEGFVGIGGVRDAVCSADLETLQRLKDVRPNKLTDYQGLLAHVNRRAASRSDLVSEACWTALVAPDQEGVIVSEFFDPQGGNRVPSLEMMLHGLDLTPMSRVFSEQAERSRRDPTFDMNSAEATAEREAAAGWGTGEDR